jgi:formylglycine-generating enzyme required for sulfatase activity
MAGNVWEWTLSKWGGRLSNPDYGYPYEQTDGREEIDGPDLRVVRGGSWLNLVRHARCAYRDGFIPDNFFDLLGFRVVVSLALS